MKINGTKAEMCQCIKNHVYLVDDKTRSVYYFDDDEKLNGIPEWEAVLLLKNGALTGMKREQYSPVSLFLEEILYIRRIETPFFIWRNTSRNICPVRLFGCIPDIYGKKFEIYLA